MDKKCFLASNATIKKRRSMRLSQVGWIHGLMWLALMLTLVCGRDMASDEEMAAGMDVAKDDKEGEMRTPKPQPLVIGMESVESSASEPEDRWPSKDPMRPSTSLAVEMPESTTTGGPEPVAPIANPQQSRDRPTPSSHELTLSKGMHHTSNSIPRSQVFTGLRRNKSRDKLFLVTLGGKFWIVDLASGRVLHKIMLDGALLSYKVKHEAKDGDEDVVMAADTLPPEIPPRFLIEPTGPGWLHHWLASESPTGQGSSAAEQPGQYFRYPWSLRELSLLLTPIQLLQPATSLMGSKLTAVVGIDVCRGRLVSKSLHQSQGQTVTDDSRSHGDACVFWFGRNEYQLHVSSRASETESRETSSSTDYFLRYQEWVEPHPIETYYLDTEFQRLVDLEDGVGPLWGGHSDGYKILNSNDNWIHIKKPTVPLNMHDASVGEAEPHSEAFWSIPLDSIPIFSFIEYNFLTGDDLDHDVNVDINDVDDYEDGKEEPVPSMPYRRTFQRVKEVALSLGHPKKSKSRLAMENDFTFLSIREYWNPLFNERFYYLCRDVATDAVLDAAAAEDTSDTSLSTSTSTSRTIIRRNGGGNGDLENDLAFVYWWPVTGNVEYPPIKVTKSSLVFLRSLNPEHPHVDTLWHENFKLKIPRRVSGMDKKGYDDDTLDLASYMLNKIRPRLPLLDDATAFAYQQQQQQQQQQSQKNQRWYLRPSYWIIFVLILFISLLYLDLLPAFIQRPLTAGLSLKKTTPLSGPIIRGNQWIFNFQVPDQEHGLEELNALDGDSLSSGGVDRIRARKIGGSTSSSLTICMDKVLGYGSHGTIVYEGQLASSVSSSSLVNAKAGPISGRRVAVKRILLEFYTLADREIHLLESTDSHPNILRYYYHFVHQPFLFLVLEYCPLSLDKLYNVRDEESNKRLLLEGSGSDKEGPSSRTMMMGKSQDMPDVCITRQMIFRLFKGLEFLHSLDIYHRDLKLGNILLNSSHTELLLSDFGLSKVDATGSPVLRRKVDWMNLTAVGTAGWKAPEILLLESMQQNVADLELKGSKKVLKKANLDGHGEEDVHNNTDNNNNNNIDADDDDDNDDGDHRRRHHHIVESDTDSVSSKPPPGFEAIVKAKPEKSVQLLSNFDYKAADIYSLGIVLYGLLTKGDHPFGSNAFQRDTRILKNDYCFDSLTALLKTHPFYLQGAAAAVRMNSMDDDDVSKRVMQDDPCIPEALDLLQRMLEKDPTKRITITKILGHPYFWTDEKRLSFLQDVSDRLTSVSDDITFGGGPLTLGDTTKTLGSSAEYPMILARAIHLQFKPHMPVQGWLPVLDPTLKTILLLDKRRKYSTNRVIDLLRAIRNKRNHFQDLPRVCRDLMSPFPTAFLHYWTCRFPELLLATWRSVFLSGVLDDPNEAIFVPYYTSLS